MARFPYDEFAKGYLTELLSSIGNIDSSRKLATEIKEIDIYYTLNSQGVVDEQRKEVLGLLGRFATSSGIFEPFRNAATPDEIRSYANKLFDIFADINRKAKNEKRKVIQTELPRLWVLSPTASKALLKGFSATLDEGWMQGVYFCGEHWKTVIVVIHKLPRTPETLWLRVLGRGKVWEQAVAEVQALGADNPLRSVAMNLLGNLKATLKVKQDRNKEDEKYLMQLSPIYERDLAEATERGLQQGVQQGQCIVVENLLTARFGSLDPELMAIVQPIVDLPASEYSNLLLQLANLSREELLARFNSGN
ncbi:hypothetical protein [Dulcicalothrix desertica]|uniref:hypothetical protein n=1 Tax=Dulcicalothrix desertica TaxID=32056 RepID=UPI00119C28E4|nr:hypothetical protein [Dulcicalothrix desertica]TWH44138.1 hypothetical protein CAL7102_07918 [Dulcicalothrix desertica PCC 7102]